MPDPIPPSGGTAPAAGADELSIPKHRFDEVNNELKRAREEMAMKDRLYMDERQRALAQQARPQQPEITPEETGLDPAVHQAVGKMATKIAERMIAESVMSSQAIGLAIQPERDQLSSGNQRC